MAIKKEAKMTGAKTAPTKTPRAKSLKSAAVSAELTAPPPSTRPADPQELPTPPPLPSSAPASLQGQGDRLKAARIDAGYPEPKDAWSKFGWPQSTYNSHEMGKRGIKPRQAEAYAKAFGVSAAWLLIGHEGQDVEVEARSPARAGLVKVNHVVKPLLPILGYVQAGVWQEVEPFDRASPLGRASVSADPRFFIEDQFVLEVKGDSMDAATPQIGPGALIRCLRYGAGPDLRSGDIAVVVLTRDDGRYEATLKRVIMTPKGIELRPESHNPRYKPIRVWKLGKGITSVHIAATVEAVIHEMRR